MSTNNILSIEIRNTDYFTKTPYFKPPFQISKNTEEQQKPLAMFYFQHSQITQKEFEQLDDLLLNYPKVYATSKLDVGKINSTLDLPLKPDAVFQKNEQVKSQFIPHIHSTI